ncbi:MAG: hypothetical protein L6416_05625 [Candidatus Omnitrophica bacterium]|nr:hypothetical protein [Candidatus Omnitrophota bacterium]
MNKFLLIFSCFLLTCNMCFSQNEFTEKSRKAKQSDLIGTWQMYYQSVSPLFLDKSLFFATYQIFEFCEDGCFKNFASKKKPKLEKINSLLQSIPRSTVYSFSGEGLLVIERSRKDFDNIIVSIAVDDFQNALRYMAPLLKKGDLIVSYRDLDKNMYMQRYLRRLNLSSN